METFKQIVYREDDNALMIIPTNDEIQIIPRFVSELSMEQQQKFEELKNICLTKIDSLKYVVYYVETNIMNLQSDEDKTIELLISDLSDGEKIIINEVGFICTELLNSN
jgi:hypothetical protein